MAQILDPIPNAQGEQILCCYVNATSQIQVVRITNIPNWYFERVAFPGQRLMFESFSEALLEVHSGMMASAILSDTIPCESLKIEDTETKVEAEKKTELVSTESVKPTETRKTEFNKDCIAVA